MPMFPNVFGRLFDRFRSPPSPITLAYLARQTGHSLTPSEIGALDTFLNGLSSAGLLALADQITWLNPKLPNPLLNVLGTSFTATSAGTVVAINDNPSLYVDGASGNALSLMASSAGVNFTQNGASWGVFFIDGTGKSFAPANDSVSRNTLTPRNTSGSAQIRINSTGAVSAAVATGYGFLLGVRPDSANIAMFKSGAKLATTTATAQLRTANPLLLGQSNGIAQGYAFNWVGGALTDAQAIALTNLVEAFMAATGVHALTNIPASITAANITVFPDATGVGAAGKGSPCTGFAVLGDGRFLLGIGTANPGTTNNGVGIIKADKSAFDAQYTLASWGLAAHTVQGVAVDSNGDGICIAANASESVLLRFNLSTGALITSTAFPSIYANGIAVDTKRNRFIVSTANNNLVSWFFKDTSGTTPLTVDTAIPTIGMSCDQICYHAATDSVLCTGGANGVAGTLNVYTTREYGAMWLKRTITLTGLLAVEGDALTNYDPVAGTASLHVNDDGNTHGQTYDRNRVQRFDSVPI